MVREGVGRSIGGRVVATVAEREEKADESKVVLPVKFVTFCKGYNPTKGGSFPAIP